MGRTRDSVSRGVRIRTYPSGRRVLEIQFSYKGMTCKETLKTLDPDQSSTRRYAINLKAEILSRIERGTFVYEDFFPNSPRARIFGAVISGVTVAHAQAAILADLRNAGSKEDPTLDQYERGARVINHHIGRIRIVDLAPDHIREIIRERRITRKTFNNYTIVLKKALRRAVNDRVIAFNPIDQVELGDLFAIRDKPRPDPFTLEEIEAILETARDYCQLLYNFAEFGIFAGPRIEELTALQWEDADLAAARVRIRRASMISIKSTAIKRVKTPASRRDIDLLPRALDALRRQREETGWRGEWVFRQFSHNQPFSNYDQINCRWRTVLKKSGVRYRPFKQCRHTFASHSLSSGVNRLLVAYQMGHSDTSKLDIYARWIEDWKDEHAVEFGHFSDQNGAVVAHVSEVPD